MEKVYKGELYRGKVKVTRRQKKKHISQMSMEEIHYLKKQIRLIPAWKTTVSKHLKEKRVTLNVSDVENTLLHQHVESLIVEYNETLDKTSGQKDRRVLIRDVTPKLVKFKTRKKTKIEAFAHLCFVISLDTYEIITAYWNKVTDSHEHINWKRYNKRLQIIQ